MRQKVTPYEFQGFLILALDRKYNTIFDGELFFQVDIDKKGRLRIISNQCLKK